MRATPTLLVSLALTALVIPAALSPSGGAVVGPGLPAPLPGPLPADPCTLLPGLPWNLSTGTAGLVHPGASLPAGAADPKWTIASAPSQTPPYLAAYRVNDVSTWWPTSGSVAKWVAPAVSTQTGNTYSTPPGTYVFEVKFPVLCPARAYLDICFAADDRVAWLLDGGIIVPAPPAPAKQYGSTLCWTSKGLLSLAPGMHTLAARVTNDCCPTGLWVDGYAVP